MRRGAVLAILIFSHAVYADGLQYIPKWHMNGDEACYTYQDAKTLVELDSKLQLCISEKQNYPKMVDALKLDLLNTEDALKQADQKAALWEKNADDLTTQLKQCNVDKAKAEADRSPGFGWAVAGALGFVIIGGALGFYLARR